MTLRIEDLGVFCGGNWLNNARILLVILLQSSKSTFLWGNFPSFFAFKEGMLGRVIAS
jgi:hypothetical protein